MDFYVISYVLSAIRKQHYDNKIHIRIMAFVVLVSLFNDPVTPYQSTKRAVLNNPDPNTVIVTKSKNILHWHWQLQYP